MWWTLTRITGWRSIDTWISSWSQRVQPDRDWLRPESPQRVLQRPPSPAPLSSRPPPSPFQESWPRWPFRGDLRQRLWPVTVTPVTSATSALVTPVAILPSLRFSTPPLAPPPGDFSSFLALQIWACHLSAATPARRPRDSGHHPAGMGCLDPIRYYNKIKKINKILFHHSNSNWDRDQLSVSKSKQLDIIPLFEPTYW